MARQKSAPTSASTPKGNRPVHVLRHRRISVSIWKNETAKGSMYNVTMKRGFKDGDAWRDSQSFGCTDLLVLAKLLHDAHSHITDLETRERVATKTKAG